MNIGERQTVDKVRHPALGEGRLVYDNGPIFFVADSGEVEHYHFLGERGSCSGPPKYSYCKAHREDGAVIEFDRTDRASGRRHDRIVTVDGRAGWLVEWFDEFHTWCNVFEPDDGGEPIKFTASQAWVGGPQDNGSNTPAKRDHLFTRKGRGMVFTFYRERHKAKAEAAALMPDVPKRKMGALSRPFPGPNATRKEIDEWRAGR